MPGAQSTERELTLAALLAARARTASDGRLALDAGGGLIATVLALALRPPMWPLLVALATCFVAYGAWGIIDRSLQEQPIGASGARLLRVLRTGAAALGILSVLAAGGLIMAVALGNWIH